MSAGAIIAIVIVFVVVAVAATVASSVLLGVGTLRHQFGPEYQRLAGEIGPRRAKAELADRRRRVAGLRIRSLTDEQRTKYAAEWRSVQERFIDSPAEATSAAEALVMLVAADRGYPADGQAQLLTDLSVHHARLLEGYRRATQSTARAGRAPTEELRQAVLAYRALFRDLLGGPADATALAGARNQAARLAIKALPDRMRPSGAAATGKETASGPGVTRVS